MRPAGRVRHLFFFAVWLVLVSSEAKAEWGYGVSGALGTGLGYSRDSSGHTNSWSFIRTDNYSLGLDGKILDPRLATFSIGSALAMSDFRSNERTSAHDSRLLSFNGNLSLLSGKPYPLDLRISQSHLSSSTDSDALSFGGTWRLVYGNLPALSLAFDRANIESTGATKTDTTFTTGILSLAKRIFDSDMDAEFGLQNFSDNINETSTLRHFGRFSDTTQWSPATVLRFIGDYFFQEDSRSVGANFSLFNRPDPTLNRSFSLGVRNTDSKDREATALDANGAISKAYYPYPTLSITPFSGASVSRTFVSGTSGDATSVNWSGGASLVSSYFRSVVASADYGLGLSYAKQEQEGSSLGTTQQFHLGLQSATLQPYSVRGDYSFLLERTLVDRTRHQASVRADGPVFPNLFFRSYAEFFNDNATFSDTQSRQTTFSLGATLTYTGIRQLFLDLGANALRSENETASSWITRLTANLNYSPRQRLTLQLGAAKETETLSEITRYEATTRVLYQFGKATVTFEYRFETRKAFDQPSQGHRISIAMNRPFRFGF